MTHTTQQLQAMSDFEVNQALAVKLGWRLDNGQGSEFTEIPVVGKSCDGLTSTVVDYCNNPNDIMPLAFERGISIMRTTDKWHVCSNRYIGEGLHFFDDLPLRAIACLILMMED